jgi:hypothetical protein
LTLLPPPPLLLRLLLLQAYGVEFNSLLCLNNMPIKRYADWLIRNDKLSEYMALLVRHVSSTFGGEGGCSRLDLQQ